MTKLEIPEVVAGVVVAIKAIVDFGVQCRIRKRVDQSRDTGQEFKKATRVIKKAFCTIILL